MAGTNISFVSNPRLTWTDSFAVFRTDGFTKAFIRQSEYESGLVVLDENSEHAIKNQELWFTVNARRNVGYAYWQDSCYVTMI
jgi:phage major head subunit gpT-like protein